MKTVRQLLISKGHDILSISPNVSVYEAIKKMAAYGVGSLVVLENNQLIGIISERDYARKIILKGRRSRETYVKEIMTPKPQTVTPSNTLQDCMEIMTNSRIRHLPVLENQQLIGVVSIGDVVKHIMSQQEYMIEQLESYIGVR